MEKNLRKKFGGATQETTETDLYELNTAYQCKTDTGTEVEEETGEEYGEEPEEEVWGSGDGDDYATVIYEDYENVYADYGDFKSIIDQVMVMTMPLSSMRTMRMFMRTM